jgi:hypothetical protein
MTTRVVLGVLCCAMWCLAANSPAQAPSCGVADDEKLSAMFSQSDVKVCLFGLDVNYALQAVYHRAGELGEVKVLPKYFLHDTHHEWKEPDSPVAMSLDAYTSLLNRIQTVKPLGKLLREGKVGIALNLRTSFQDLYEKGVVDRAMFRISPDRVYDVALFRVLYFRNISGIVESAEAPGAQTPDQGYRLKLNGKWYWTTDHSFKGVALGQQVTVEAAGPITD